MAPISTAVGCAVGIPIGLGVLVALFFWARMQRRLKKEEEEDKELQNVLQDNESIAFGNLESLKQPEVWENKKHVSGDIAKEDTEVCYDHKVSDHHISGSGSSDGSVSHEEKLSASAAGNDKGRNSKLFVPAYRRKINTLQAKLTGSAGNSTRNSSSTSLTSSQKIPRTQVSVYDQMIPVVASDAQGIFDDNEEKDRQSSNDHLIRNLNNQDFGSYPRRASSSSLSQLHSTNHSSSSFHTRASSLSSALKPGAPAENVFATPKSEKVLGNKSRTDDRVDKQDRQGKHDDVYLLKNNYDITNSSEIAEEDQYENEFTNYSANKREFIDSLRPKKL
ncbi:hypothetical protein HG536_0C00250 [Torulaspora globosa]|uniref:Suppressor of lethality of KEX2 GAS1 double null mutant protein 1 n=1 Tax=Torulaspora globosa TaxID=48254 RepID=A0A7G3ZEC2_9SACH|nr:uncharacterized protein HG536_0C00250 [Torulaspora globosa]QLL31858.1 hypothetical protein HG536_0C00250 [Torulaspora globosa]